MNDGPLDDALETCCWLHIQTVAVTDNRRQFHLNIFIQLFQKRGNINIAGGQHFAGIIIISQRQQQMFKRGKFMRS